MVGLDRRVKRLVGFLLGVGHPVVVDHCVWLLPLSGDGVCIGYDSGDAASSQSSGCGKFVGGAIQAVGVSVKGEPYVNLEAEA